MSQSDRPRITGRKTVWEHGSEKFRIDELAVEHGGSDEKPPEQIRWASFERGDAVAALIVNTDTDNVILVSQFRPPIHGKGGSDGNLIETAAGMIRQNEEPWQCLQREIEEETGYQLEHDLVTGELNGTELIGKFFASPGGSSEKIHLYYVEINSETVKKSGGGIKEHGEFVDAVLVPIDEFFHRLDSGDFQDPKILIAGHWLNNRRRNRRFKQEVGAKPQNKQEFELIEPSTNGDKKKKPRTIGYYRGDIGEITDVDIWVNSANTEFLMDTIYHRTLSARIRTLGATVSGGTLVDDIIQRDLKRALGSGAGIDVGNVLVTGPGELKRNHNVRRLLHVASIKARIDHSGRKVTTITNISDFKKCVDAALEACAELNSVTNIGYWTGGPYRSIIMPLFGAGVDRSSTQKANELSTRKICEELIPAAIDYLLSNPKLTLSNVYFLAYKPIEIEIIDSIMSRHPHLTRIRSSPVNGDPLEPQSAPQPENQ